MVVCFNLTCIASTSCFATVCGRRMVTAVAAHRSLNWHWSLSTSRVYPLVVLVSCVDPQLVKAQAGRCPLSQNLRWKQRLDTVLHAMLYRHRMAHGIRSASVA